VNNPLNDLIHNPEGDAEYEQRRQAHVLAIQEAVESQRSQDQRSGAVQALRDALEAYILALMFSADQQQRLDEGVVANHTQAIVAALVAWGGLARGYPEAVEHLDAAEGPQWGPAEALTAAKAILKQAAGGAAENELRVTVRDILGRPRLACVLQSMSPLCTALARDDAPHLWVEKDAGEAEEAIAESPGEAEFVKRMVATFTGIKNEYVEVLERAKGMSKTRRRLLELVCERGGTYLLPELAFEMKWDLSEIKGWKNSWNSARREINTELAKLKKSFHLVRKTNYARLIPGIEPRQKSVKNDFFLTLFLSR
jgi:hypothetical protein